jgi:hypothetical protein
MPVHPLPRYTGTIPGTAAPTGGLFGNSYPSLAVDRSNGRYRGHLYVAWADNVGVYHSGQGYSGPDILLVRSSDGGQSWCGPVRVSDDSWGAYPTGEYQWQPSVSVDLAGNIDVVFYDRSETPGTPVYRLRRARSVDGGQTFQASVPIADATSNLNNDGVDVPVVAMGDYSAVVVTGDSVIPFWTDERSNADGFVARNATAGPQPPPECPPETADVLTQTMRAYVDAGPYTGTTTLHFVFGTRHTADAFEVQYKLHSDPTFATLSCSTQSASCRWNCDGTLEATTVFYDCGVFSFDWRARAHNCQGWQSNWSATKSFKTQCMEQP